MATFRVGVGSFNIKDGAVGFGTDTDGLGNLKVKGVTKTKGSIVSGASTLTRYSGFAADNINQLENITLTSEVGTIGDIVVGVGTSVIISSASTVTVGTLESVSIGTHFSPPKGGIEERGQDFVEGMMRFNTDLNTMEFYNGNEWRQFRYQADITKSPSTMGRAVFGASFQINTLDFINMHTLGNALSFGDSLFGAQGRGGCSSNTRGLWAGGYGNTGSGYLTNNIDYITLASEGNAIDFGDINTSTSNKYAHASSTRGVWPGGASATNVIDYVEIGTLGNALDFGDLFEAKQLAGTTSSPVRGVSGGGSAPTATDTVEFITIASKGNGTDFGNLTNKRTMAGGMSNGTRAVFASGSTPSYNIKTIDYFDIMTGGSSIDFGEMSITRGWSGTTSSKTRGIIAGGLNPTYQNLIEFITIASAGNAQYFGDLTVSRHMGGGVSDCHGGLGGY